MCHMIETCSRQRQVTTRKPPIIQQKDGIGPSPTSFGFAEPIRWAIKSCGNQVGYRRHRAPFEKKCSSDTRPRHDSTSGWLFLWLRQVDFDFTIFYDSRVGSHMTGWIIETMSGFHIVLPPMPGAGHRLPLDIALA